MLTATPGLKNGNLVVNSDAPDDPVMNVALSGTVLAHAAASLDSATVTLARIVDFGEHTAGGFSDQTVLVYNSGSNALQARLSLDTAEFTAGADRFSLPDGFGPALLGLEGYPVLVTFDDSGAQVDSTYTGTLVFTSADEPLPGATAQPELVVTLTARVIGGTTGVPAEVVLPTATRLYAPTPNPLAGSSMIRLDLAQATTASVAVFDPTGRQVAVLRQGALAAGQYRLTWDGRTDDGRHVGSGVYFVRLSAPGLRPQAVRVTVIR
jgi:hypothetical protein